MYGATDRPTFRMLEGYEDHAVDALFVWTADGTLLATAIDVACDDALRERLLLRPR